jgi:hypothetical protein
MVALRSASGDENVAATGEGVGDEELELASLVPTGGEAGAVVSLDPEAVRWKSERRAEAIGPLQACREVGKHQICHGLSLSTSALLLAGITADPAITRMPS